MNPVKIFLMIDCPFLWDLDIIPIDTECKECLNVHGSLTDKRGSENSEDIVLRSNCTCILLHLLMLCKLKATYTYCLYNTSVIMRFNVSGCYFA